MTPLVLTPRSPLRQQARSRPRHRASRQPMLMLVASVTGLAALVLAVGVSFSGLLG